MSELSSRPFRVFACGRIACLFATASLVWTTAARADVYLDVVISELMYHAPGTDEDREYIELTNRGSQTVDLTGWRLGDGISYDFPPGTVLAPGERLCIAQDPISAAAVYGITFLGPYSGRLANDGERIELRNEFDGLVCEVEYDDEAPWPEGGDGDGRSIELIDLDKNHNVGRFWTPSAKLLGSPGAANIPSPAPPVTVVINEFLANSSSSDWIELYNPGDAAVDLDGFYLTDTPHNPTKARISASYSAGTTLIPAKGYWIATQGDVGFGLSTTGEQLYLVAPDGQTWVDGCDFGNQPLEDASEGRYPDGGGTWIKMTTLTPGAANVAATPPPIVINEIMYHPAGDSPTNPTTEYIEIRNTGGSPVELCPVLDGVPTPWSLSGGVSFDFPPGTIITAGGYLVIAHDPDLVQSTYGITGVLGPYNGRLSNFSDEIEIRDALGNRVDIMEYRQEGLWPTAPDGTGPSLERISYAMDSLLPGTWRASTGTGTPGELNSQNPSNNPNPAASIDRVRHEPLVPTSGDTVTVTARVGAGSLTTVTLYHKRDQDGSFTSTAMDDGGPGGPSGADETAGDGIYTGTIPPRAHDTVMEFYIVAGATAGNVRFPANGDADYFIPVRTCLYAVDDTVIDSNLTIFRIVINDENHGYVINSPYNGDTYDNRKRNCTLIIGDKAYHTSRIRLRSGTRGGPKYSYKVHLPDGYHFRDADRFNLNFRKADETLLRNKIINQLVGDMGLPSARTEYIHTRYHRRANPAIPTSDAGIHLYADAHCDDFIDRHFPNEDQNGAMYKGIAPWITTWGSWNIAWGASCSWFELELDGSTCSDLSELFAATRPDVPDATYESGVRNIVDVDNWGRSLAVWGVTCLIDSPWMIHNQNYRLYRRPSDHRFVHLLYDFDDTYWDTEPSGQWDTWGFFSSTYHDVQRWYNHPPFRREILHGGWRALNTNSGVFREDRVLSAVAYYHHLIYDDVYHDPAIGFGTSGWDKFVRGLDGPDAGFDNMHWEHRLTIRNNLLRAQLAPYHEPDVYLAITTNGGQAITTDTPTVVLEGTAPVSAARLEIHGSEEGIEWPSVTQWRREITIADALTTVIVRTLDDNGSQIDQVTINIYYGGTVDFAANATSGPAPLTVQFSDLSDLPGITGWDWTFGDGGTSQAQHPVHQYTQNGVYTVRLTVATAQGPATREKAEYIHVGVDTEIINPSFEDASYFLTGWSSCLAGESSIKHNPGTHTPIPRFHDGANSIGMSSVKPGDLLSAGAIWQEVDVIPGRQYHVRFWASLRAEVYPALHEIRLRIRDGDASPLSCSGGGDGITNNSVSYARVVGSDSADWVPLEGTVVPTQNVITLIAYWKFAGTDWQIKSLHVDDWSITDITPIPIPADLDSDGDVDQDDYDSFEPCSSGSGVPHIAAPACNAADLDHDGDVDQSDFAIVQRCYSGENVPANPDCAY